MPQIRPLSCAFLRLSRRCRDLNSGGLDSRRGAIGLEDLALQAAFLFPVHIAAGAERFVPRPGEDDHADLGVRTRTLDGERQLPQRVAGERVVKPKRMPPTRGAGWSSPRSATGASPSRSPTALTSGRSARSRPNDRPRQPRVGRARGGEDKRVISGAHVSGPATRDAPEAPVSCRGVGRTGVDAGTAARDVDGQRVRSTSSQATALCVVGAVDRALRAAEPRCLRPAGPRGRRLRHGAVPPGGPARAPAAAPASARPRRPGDLE